MEQNRPSPIAGLWYPEDPQQLIKEINQYLDLVKQEPIQGHILALMVPHAGYRYSGKTAAHAYHTLIGKPLQTIFLLSPFHDYHTAKLLSTTYQAYQTPLGEVAIDHEKMQLINQGLLQKGSLTIQQISRDKEHSLEIQLPFLQTILKQPFKIVPIMVRTRNPKTCQILAEIIAGIFNIENHLIIASTDLSHFYPESTANKLDQVIMNAVKEMQPQSIFNAEEKGIGFACGAGALSTAIWAAKKIGAEQSKILYYTTSAETTHDTQSVVGYGAAAIYKSL
ncbi:MAG: AmmeMemoRadiSam system protein B [Anaerolineaceae bacterium]|nr:AmmeMemoRadiSam system protein B [Anaerolineaceae bacterium]